MTNETLRRIDEVIADGPFAASWDSLARYTVPSWYEDAKFGIFIHWGVYSVPAYGNEWYPRQMYMEGSAEFQHHLAAYGPQKEFGYKDFIPLFKAEKFDPRAWAELFQAAGAKYVVPVAEHHDGFQMYDSAFSRWNAARMGPCRDVLAELAAAVRNLGMTFGVSSHRAEHWWFMDGGMKFDSDVRDPHDLDFYGPAQPAPARLEDPLENGPDEAYLQDWLARTCEIVDKYRPEIVWFDWWIQNINFQPYLRRFAAYYYNRAVQWRRGVAINHKYTAFPEGTAVLDIERGQMTKIRPLFWQTDTSIANNSWGYVHDRDYKTAGEILSGLADIVSKNGALLLNIGPRPDGTIPQEEQDILLEIGRWLSVNGEAIYGTRPWQIHGEGPTEVAEGAFTDTKRADFTSRDVRFTARDSAVYAITLAWPADGHVTIASPAQGTLDIRSVELLGCPAPPAWRQNEAGLAIDMPAQASGKYAAVFKLRVD